MSSRSSSSSRITGSSKNTDKNTSNTTPSGNICKTLTAKIPSWVSRPHLEHNPRTYPVVFGIKYTGTAKDAIDPLESVKRAVQRLFDVEFRSSSRQAVFGAVRVAKEGEEWTYLESRRDCGNETGYGYSSSYHGSSGNGNSNKNDRDPNAIRKFHQGQHDQFAEGYWTPGYFTGKPMDKLGKKVPIKGKTGKSSSSSSSSSPSFSFVRSKTKGGSGSQHISSSRSGSRRVSTSVSGTETSNRKYASWSYRTNAKDCEREMTILIDFPEKVKEGGEVESIIRRCSGGGLRL